MMDDGMNGGGDDGMSPNPEETTPAAPMPSEGGDGGDNGGMGGDGMGGEETTGA